MKITLVQSEIELAIRQYIGSTLRVAEGMEMVIDLAATRGDEGFKATIDIQPMGNAPKQEQLKPAVVTQSKPPIFTPRVISPAQAPLVEAAKEAETLKDQRNSDDTADDEASKTDSTAETTTETETDKTDTSAAGSTSGGRSLFKGLAKPKNS